eukprot:1215096-Lingulodinium_polyedra.AAC.2
MQCQPAGEVLVQGNRAVAQAKEHFPEVLHLLALGEAGRHTPFQSIVTDVSNTTTAHNPLCQKLIFGVETCIQGLLSPPYSAHHVFLL